eukprot:748051-Hanusia_phi.AAC.3
MEQEFPQQPASPWTCTLGPCGTSSSFFNKWVCGTGSENPTHNDGSYFNMVRILFPPGFDTQQATLTNETVDITSAMYYPKIRSYQLFDVNGTEYTVNETYYVPTFYQSFGQVSMLKKTPQPSGYGIREPYPQDFPEYIDGVLAESRVGSTRGSRDPASGFDPRRVVDFGERSTDPFSVDPLANLQFSLKFLGI